MWNYLMSILIFYIIIKASISIVKVFLDGNGRLEKIIIFNDKNKGPKLSILVASCIPFFRLIVVFVIYYICFCSEEEFNKIIKKED